MIAAVVALLALAGILWWRRLPFGVAPTQGGRPALPPGTPLDRARTATPGSTTTEWLHHTVQYFRAMGFFAQFAEWPDMVLATHLEQLHRQTRGRPFDPGDPHADLHLLKHDVKRVWWEDTEHRVSPRREVYEATLPLWSAISRRAFTPRHIIEDWDTPRGPISVSFDLDGAPHVLRPRVDGGRLDVNILREINLLIEHGGIRFERLRPFDSTAFVVALTPEEKRLLHQERGWEFAW